MPDKTAINLYRLGDNLYSNHDKSKFYFINENHKFEIIPFDEIKRIYPKIVINDSNEFEEEF